MDSSVYALDPQECTSFIANPIFKNSRLVNHEKENIFWILSFILSTIKNEQEAFKNMKRNKLNLLKDILLLCHLGTHIQTNMLFPIDFFYFSTWDFHSSPFFMSLACIWGKGIARLGMLSSLNASMFALTTIQLTQFKLLRCNNWLSSNDLLTVIIRFVCVNPFLIQMQKIFMHLHGIGFHVDKGKGLK